MADNHESCESCRKKLLAKADELEAVGHEAVRNPPGRSRRFEQVKVIERDFYKMSEADFKAAREDMMKVMQKYRGE